MTSFKSKVEQSSLGSREAQAARKTVSTRQANSAVSRSIALRSAAEKKSAEREGKQRGTDI